MIDEVVRLYSQTFLSSMEKDFDNTLKRLIKMALVEDFGTGDITTNALKIIDAKVGVKSCNKSYDIKKMGRGEVVVKDKKVVVCGLKVADFLFGKRSGISKKVLVEKKSYSLSQNKKVIRHLKDGEEAVQNDKVLTIIAPLEELLNKERILLNFLQHLCGTATQSRKWSQELHKTLGNVHLLDTRKTLPGYRVLEKYAVFCGGGHNHRMGLFDHYLIKDNHIGVAGGVIPALKKILQHRSRYSLKGRKHKPWVEIECRNLAEVREVVAFNQSCRISNEKGADIIMLDNLSLKEIRLALSIIDKSCRVEVSGNIDLAKIKKLSPLKGQGINYVSAGSLTHSVVAADLSMNIEHA